MVIDGGKSQLSAALAVFKSRAIPMDVIGIAKGERRKRMEDVLYLPFRKNPLLLPRSSPVFKEIVRMRDEAHRFAVTSHRRWKRREDLTSGLGEIKGVGKKRLKAAPHAVPVDRGHKGGRGRRHSTIPGFTRNVAEEIVRAIGEKGEKA